MRSIFGKMISSRFRVSEEDLLAYIQKYPGITYNRILIVFHRKEIRRRMADFVRQGKLRTKRSGWKNELLYFIS
jgi:hypothetical protein